MAPRLRAAHYLNQFFGQIGGEDQADVDFLIKEGPIGPGLVLQEELNPFAEIVATIICGDNYFSQNPSLASDEGLKLIEPFEPELFVAGPAFAAGRYGISCGSISKIVGERLKIPVITGMAEENPAIDLYRKHAFICKTGASARDMQGSLARMAKLAGRLLSGEPNKDLVSLENIPNPAKYGYFPRLIIRNEYVPHTVAERSISKLIAKIMGEPFESEAEITTIDRYPPPAAIQDPSVCEFALVSDGGLVPRGNPDGFSGRGNLRWSSYEIGDFFPATVESSDCEIAHTGYFPDEILQDPNRLVPVDVMRELQAEGKIGKLHPRLFSTSGNATLAERCAEIGDEMAAEISRGEIDAVILTST